MPITAWLYYADHALAPICRSVTLANKLARICYATLRDGKPYGATRLNKKVTRTAFALPA